MNVKAMVEKALAAHRINNGLCAGCEDWYEVDPDEYPHFDEEDNRQSQATISKIEGEHFTVFVLYTEDSYALDVIWDEELSEAYMFCRFRGVPRYAH